MIKDELMHPAKMNTYIITNLEICFLKFMNLPHSLRETPKYFLTKDNKTKSYSLFIQNIVLCNYLIM